MVGFVGLVFYSIQPSTTNKPTINKQTINRSSNREAEPSDPPSPVPPDVLASAPVSAIPGLQLQNGFRLRDGQARFLGKLADAFARGETGHLGVFVPGYGKTITALASFVIAHRLGVAQKLVVFVPRGNLRDQYADAAALQRVFADLGAPPFAFCVADSDQVFLKNLHTPIVVTTYQYASGAGGNRALLRYCESAPCLFVFDEVHHLSDDGTWAGQIGRFPHSASVALSGTPMRSDNKTLFGVPFERRDDGEQYYVALHEVGLRDAHAEGGILKTVAAHVVDYHLRLVRDDTGDEVEVSLSGLREMARDSRELDAFLARRKLRFHDVYLDTLLRPAFTRFAEKRRALAGWAVANGVPAPRPPQMLVIAMSNRHARAILHFVRRHFGAFSSDRIGQDLPARDCARTLDRYRDGALDVMVQVDMIGEGTDIKPISTVVKADLVRAPGKTLQQVFRGMRYYDAWPEALNTCDLYAANDSDVVGVLEWLATEQQMGVRMRKKRAGGGAAPTSAPERSRWDLAHVEHQRMKSHALELTSGAAGAQLQVREVPAVVDVAAREKALRKACAALAVELQYTLQNAGRPADVRQIHARARQVVGRAQQHLSLPELEQKRRWLERCLRSRRLL